MESQTTEYKQQWSDKYLAYISGFANAQGGTLYIGINDAGEVVGINNAKYLLENLPNKAIQSTGIIPDIEILTKDATCPLQHLRIFGTGRLSKCLVTRLTK